MISVCMATYNGERYVLEQLRSILVQLGQKDEVIVCDDSSTDNTCSLVKSIQDERIRLFHTAFHHHKWNFEYALQQAQGDIIFLSDQDDVWLPNKIAVGVQALEKYDLVMLNSTLTDEVMNVIEPSFFAYYHSGPGLLKNVLLCTYFGSHMAFRRNVLEAALPFPTSKSVFHDVWLGLVAEKIGEVLFDSTPTMYYRRHDNAPTQISDNILTRSKRNIFVKLWDRIVILTHILFFQFKHKQ